MVTVITETSVKSGRESEWDEAYRERAAAARAQDGWVESHLLVPLDDRSSRVVVGTWRDRRAWQAWHTSEAFQSTRQRLDAATDRHGSERWFEVIVEEQAD